MISIVKSASNNCTATEYCTITAFRVKSHSNLTKHTYLTNYHQLLHRYPINKYLLIYVIISLVCNPTIWCFKASTEQTQQQQHSVIKSTATHSVITATNSIDYQKINYSNESEIKENDDDDNNNNNNKNNNNNNLNDNNNNNNNNDDDDDDDDDNKDNNNTNNNEKNKNENENENENDDVCGVWVGCWSEGVLWTQILFLLMWDQVQ